MQKELKEPVLVLMEVYIALLAVQCSFEDSRGRYQESMFVLLHFLS